MNITVSHKTKMAAKLMYSVISICIALLLALFSFCSYTDTSILLIEPPEYRNSHVYTKEAYYGHDNITKLHDNSNHDNDDQDLATLHAKVSKLPVPPGLDNIPTFLKDYKNPCWKQKRQLQCLPYFFIGGFAKCGTTDLFGRLLQHPQILKGKAKEPHWWTRQRFNREFNRKSPKFLQWYLEFFEGGADKIEKNNDGNNILIIRDPTQKMYSDYNYFHKD